MIFVQICAFQWTEVKQFFGRIFYHFTILRFKMQKKKNFLKKISVLIAIFIELKYRRLQTRLPALKNKSILFQS